MQGCNSSTGAAIREPVTPRQPTKPTNGMTPNPLTNDLFTDLREDRPQPPKLPVVQSDKSPAQPEPLAGPDLTKLSPAEACQLLRWCYQAMPGRRVWLLGQVWSYLGIDRERGMPRLVPDQHQPREILTLDELTLSDLPPAKMDSPCRTCGDLILSNEVGF